MSVKFSLKIGVIGAEGGTQSGEVWTGVHAPVALSHTPKGKYRV